MDEVVVEGGASADEEEEENDSSESDIDIEEIEDEEAVREYRNKRRRVDELLNEQLLCNLLHVNPPEVEESQVFDEDEGTEVRDKAKRLLKFSRGRNKAISIFFSF